MHPFIRRPLIEPGPVDRIIEEHAEAKELANESISDLESVQFAKMPAINLIVRLIQ